jgi:hypothetical protein
MRVRLFRPAKSAAQQGRAKSHEWVIEPELLTRRTPDPIMGWASAGDTLAEMTGRLVFPTQDDALAFAKNKGWEIILEEPAERKIQPRNYLDNFKIVRAIDEERATK